MARFSFNLGRFIALAPWLVLCLCLLLTWQVWSLASRNELKAAQVQFDAAVRDVHTRINVRLDNYSFLLRGAAGLFAASQSVERSEFHEYVEELALDKNYPGIQGIGYAQLLGPQQKPQLIARMRREGFPQFNIRPEGERDPYTAIVYLEPKDWRNQRAIGYDMFSEPTRRAAMERARDTGAPAMSGKVVLVQETEKEVQPGFLMYMPVYRNQLPHDTLEARRRNLQGWVYEPFRMRDLMTRGVLGAYLDTFRGQLDIEIYDGDARNSAALMFDSQPEITISSNFQPRFSSTQTVTYFGHTWTICIHSLPEFDAQAVDGRSRLALGGGLTISLLLTLVVWLLSTTNARASHLAERMGNRLSNALTQTVSAMSTLIEMRDPYTSGHQQRAAELARAIALEMGLQGDQLQALNFAALIYEIGKIQVPAEILSKPARLDAAEYALIQTHALGGAEVLREIDFPWPVARIVEQHHERMDGSGYPLGLQGDEIMLEARIIAVADVVEAMCSFRPYRPALGLDAALEELAAGRGTRYDADVVDACVRLFREHGFVFLHEAVDTSKNR